MAPMLMWLQQLSPIPCHITTGSGGAALLNFKATASAARLAPKANEKIRKAIADSRDSTESPTTRQSDKVLFLCFQYMVCRKSFPNTGREQWVHY